MDPLQPASGVAYSQPTTPQQLDAVYACDAHFVKPPSTYNCTTSQYTNDLMLGKEFVILQNTSAVWNMKQTEDARQFYKLFDKVPDDAQFSDHWEYMEMKWITSMDGNALVPAVQGRPQMPSTLGSSGSSGTAVGTSAPGKALPNVCGSHLVRCADSESKIGSEDGGSANTGASTRGAVVISRLPTKKRNRGRAFKCDIEECDKEFFRKYHQNRHMLTHSKTIPYVRPFCIPPSFIPLLTYLHLL